MSLLKLHPWRIALFRGVALYRVPARERRGFSLLEVLVAMTILSMAFAGLFALSSRSLEGMSRARDMERRVELARTKLAELKLVTDLQPGDRASGVFEDKSQWALEVLPFIEPVPAGPRNNPNSTVRIRLTLQWQGRREPQTWTVETYRFVRPRALTTPRTSLEAQLREIAPQ